MRWTTQTWRIDFATGMSHRMSCMPGSARLKMNWKHSLRIMATARFLVLRGRLPGPIAARLESLCRQLSQTTETTALDGFVGSLEDMGPAGSFVKPLDDNVFTGPLVLRGRYTGSAVFAVFAAQWLSSILAGSWP
jgi:hypothetical protein